MDILRFTSETNQATGVSQKNAVRKMLEGWEVNETIYVGVWHDG